MTYQVINKWSEGISIEYGKNVSVILPDGIVTVMVANSKGHSKIFPVNGDTKIDIKAETIAHIPDPELYFKQKPFKVDIDFD
jgi:hypothetical protein